LSDEFTPPQLKAAKDAYVAENDTIGEFIDECLAPDVTATESKDDLYQAYKTWATEAGRHPLAKNNLGQRLTGRGWKDKRGHGGIWQWTGYRVARIGGIDKNPKYFPKNSGDTGDTRKGNFPI
jgi:phage/plasmid-associated DNA primase